MMAATPTSTAQPLLQPLQPAVRQNRGILAALEKRALVWIAWRLPAWIGSDHLSAFGLSAMAAAGLSFAALDRGFWAAAAVVFFLAMNWLGDSLDGTLARIRGHERPRYGFYVDHAIDLAGTTMLMAGLCASGFMSPMLGLSVLVAYLLVSAESYLATHALGVFRMSFLRIGPTELRILLAAGAIKAAATPDVTVMGVSFRLFDVGGSVAVIGLAIAFVVSAIRNGRTLYRTEPLPPSRQESSAA